MEFWYGLYGMQSPRVHPRAWAGLYGEVVEHAERAEDEPEFQHCPLRRRGAASLQQ